MGGRGSGRKATKEPDYDKGRELYERQSFESDPAWAAFLAYRDLGPDRTQVLACEVLGKHPRYQATLEGWSAKHGWVKRCLAWDRHLDDIARAEADKEAKRIAKAKLAQMRQVAEGMYLLAGGTLEQWHEKLREAQAAAEEAKKKGEASPDPLLSAKELEGLANTGIKIARMLDDQPGEIIEKRVTSLADLARKAKEKKGG